MPKVTKKADIYIESESVEICITVKLKNDQNYFDQMKDYCDKFTKNYVLKSIYFREEKTI